MPQNIQHTSSYAPYTVLVTFTWGDSNVARYCKWTQDLVAGSETFIAEPRIAAKLKKPMEGGTSAEEAEITLPLTRAPMDTAALPYKHATIKVKIEEFSPGSPSSRRSLFFGRVGKIKISSSGSGGVAKIQVKGVKARLAETTIGLQALTSCANTFGVGKCKFDLAAAKQVFVPTQFFHSTIPNRIQGTITGSPNMDNERWARGYLKFDGVSITIRKIEDEGTNPNPTVTISLREIPPPSWLGQSVDIFPGCKKTPAACKDPFRNQARQFMGLGISMLAYNPGFSDAPDA